MNTPKTYLPSRLLLIMAALAVSTLTAACGDDAGAAPDVGFDAALDAGPDATEDSSVDTSAGVARVVINEVSISGEDWVELYNDGDAAADISAWLLRDSDPQHEYRFPASSILPAGVYLIVKRDADLGFDFGLGDADSVLLYDGDTLVDSISWIAGEIPDGLTLGRFPNGSGGFGIRYAPTPGKANQANEEISCDNGVLEPTEVCDGADFGALSCERFGWKGGALTCADDCESFTTSSCTPLDAALVINEVSSSADDRVELFNNTADAIDLAGWTITDDADNSWTFPAGRAIAAGAYLVLVKGSDHDFGLGGGDAVTLRDGQGQIVDIADWDKGQATVSWCRRPNGVGGFEACEAPSFGAANP